jgi:diguanylate cyclase (GGDEF)-like protein
MTEPLDDPAQSSTVSFSRRHMLAEFLLCILLVSGFGAGTLYVLHVQQESSVSIAHAAVRSGNLDPAAQQHHMRGERNVRIMLAATTLLSLVLIVAVYWRMDRLCSMFARAREEAHHQAHHDALTGLPNARLLHDRLAMALAHARRVGQMVAVVALELEGFAQVNEEHGPDAGEEVLQQAAMRLQRLSRDADTVARLDADEFVMVLSDVKSRSHVAGFAERLINNLSGTYTANGQDVSVGARVGLSLFSGQATSADDLARAATAALAKVRSSGNARIEFSPGAAEPASAR